MTIHATSSMPDLATWVQQLAMLEPAQDEATAIDRISLLEQLKAACAAAQANETAALETLRLAAEAANGVPKTRRGKGLAAEIGLARHQSSSRGTRYLELARGLVRDLPRTHEALTSGTITEETAELVANETATLSPKHRREVDTVIAPRLTAGLGPRQLASEVRAHAQRLDAKNAAKQFAKAKAQRRVELRAAGHGMSKVMALLPTPQAVAVVNGLRKEALGVLSDGKSADPNEPAAGTRTLDQIMADRLVERITGQETAPAVPAEVQLIMTDTALFGDDPSPAWLQGHGPIPAGIAKHWLGNPDAKVLLRRLFSSPKTHQLVALESQSRVFRGGLREMVMLRDQHCRNPYCDAPIRDIDHVTPLRDGGTTSWANSSGLCGACNQTKENNGWRHTSTPDTLTVTTPTGHQYRSTTGAVLPGRAPPSTPTDEQLQTHPPPDDPHERQPPAA